jgi:hypothetical protein
LVYYYFLSLKIQFFILVLIKEMCDKNTDFKSSNIPSQQKVSENQGKVLGQNKFSKDGKGQAKENFKQPGCGSPSYNVSPIGIL